LHLRFEIRSATARRKWVRDLLAGRVHICSKIESSISDAMQFIALGI